MTIKVVESNRKALFTLATTRRCRGGCFSFSWIAPLYPSSISYSAEEVSSTIFWIFGMTWPGIESWSLRPLANALSTWKIPWGSQLKSYQSLKKWYLMLSCLTLSTIRYGWRVKWSNPGKGIVPSPTPQCISCWKGSIWVTLDYGRQLDLYTYLLQSFWFYWFERR